MSRLIDADALKIHNARLLHCDFPYLSEITLEELIDEAPTIDAVEVVRCRDCKWGEVEFGFHHHPIYCHFHEHYWKPDDYCSYGQKK